MPRYRKPERRWPRILMIVLPVCLLAAIVLLVPLPKHIQDTYTCSSVSPDGTVTDGGKVTLDVWHLNFLVLEDRLSGSIKLPNGMKTTASAQNFALFDAGKGSLQANGGVIDPFRDETCSLIIYITDDFSNWLFHVDNFRYLVSENPIENVEDLNTLFEGFSVWP